MKKITLAILLIVATPTLAQTAAKSYGPIKTGEMLWNIAAQVRPDSSISRYQAMLALHKTNPHAFEIPCNINSLKIGKILYIPSRADMQTLTKAQAVKEFNLQQKEWKAHRKQGQKIVCSQTAELQVTEPEKPIPSLFKNIFTPKTEAKREQPVSPPIKQAKVPENSHTETEKTILTPIAFIWKNTRLWLSNPLHLSITIGSVALLLLILIAFFIGRSTTTKRSYKHKKLAHSQKTKKLGEILEDTYIINAETANTANQTSQNNPSDKMQEKLNNVRAYIAEDEEQITQKMLREVIQKGTVEQQAEAKQLYEIYRKINSLQQDKMAMPKSATSNPAWPDLEKMGEHCSTQNLLENKDKLFKLIDKIFELLDYELNAQGKLIEAYNTKRPQQDFLGKKNYEIVEKSEKFVVDDEGKPRHEQDQTRYM
jgi:FimV-like protein